VPRVWALALICCPFAGHHVAETGSGVEWIDGRRPCEEPLMIDLDHAPRAVVFEEDRADCEFPLNANRCRQVSAAAVVEFDVVLGHRLAGLGFVHLCGVCLGR
jgi:hypothetical protein